ncbi:MAG: hypothetical protein IJ111_13920 [Eggerthellaceae bacterium]|nr:hypothetical protein [Eggerthellaceae bacterium]
MAEEFETVELEYSEDDILYYIEDEDGTEIGFALEEDGVEVEYYYEGFEADDYETVSVVEEVAAEAPSVKKGESATKPDKPGDAEPKDRGYLYKMAAIVGHEGNKARGKAEEKLDVARGKAEEQYGKAKKVATEQAGKAKAKADDMDLGITREGVAEVTSDLNAIAKEGAETAKELKEAYDDIMENFGFLVPKKVRRRLP